MAPFRKQVCPMFSSWTKWLMRQLSDIPRRRLYLSKTFNNLEDKDKEAIKDRYLGGESIIALSEEYDIKRTSLQYYVNKNWKEEKALMEAELFQKFTTTKREAFLKMSDSSIKIIMKALEGISNREEPPTIAEAKKATEILESLDKITRLDEGKPTDIAEERVMTAIEVRQKLGLDPFYKPNELKNSSIVEEVEFETVIEEDADSVN